MLNRSILQFAACAAMICLTACGWHNHDVLAPGMNTAVAASLGKLINAEALLTLDRPARAPLHIATLSRYHATKNTKLDVGDVHFTHSVPSAAAHGADSGARVLTMAAATPASGAGGSASASASASASPH